MTSARARGAAVAAGCLVVALAGAALGILLAGHQDARVGPVDVRLGLQPSLSGGSELRVPPLGTMEFGTHHGPLAVRASVVELRADVARSLAEDPGGFATVGDRVGNDLHSALLRLVLRASAAALVACALLSLIVFRSLRRTALCLGMCVASIAVTAGIAAATWRPGSIREPKYTGLLASAPTAIGSAEQIITNFSAYRLALGQLVGNVVQLYDVTSSLPTYRPTGSTIALLHISDLHLNPAGIDLVVSLVSQFKVRGVIDTGDLTDHGSAAEGPFVDDLRRIPVPYVAIRGNHDSDTTVEQVRRLPDATVLDGAVTTLAGIRIAGIADPRFTPDKSVTIADADGLVESGRQLADVIRAEPAPVNVALVHDPLAGGALAGVAPLVLAGHRHHREQRVDGGSLFLVQGSTGGAGLRGLQGEEPTPLECSILYFDSESHQLQAWDEVTVGGLGSSSVTVERHVRPTSVGVTPSPGASP
ncbi:MAG: metallophosphoesterase [Frankiaceae bacterium]|nr:metallophosphoesterase [Frankiaceae bacterium]